MALVVYQGPPENFIDGIQAGIGESESVPKFVGLSNQGATCYLNSLLQTLFMTPDFRKAIFMWNYDSVKDGAEEFCIPLQLQRLFGLLQLSKQRSVDTVALTHSFGWEGSEVFQQQDVQELTRVLFDALEETFKGTPVENIIDDLYAGELIDYLRCLDVDYESERVDKFLDFSLAIVPFGSDKPMCNLTECIEMFLRPEILDGENKYHVEKFDRKVDAIKGLKFGKLPKIMSVQLKRFVYDFSGPSIVQKKLNDVVKFPMILDMNKYVAKRVTAGSSTAKKTSEVVEEDDEDHMNLRESNEFEVFLREQMDLLKSGRLADAEQESSSCAPAAVPQLISEPPDYYDEIPHSCFECADSTATTAFAVATAAEEEVHGKNKEEGTEREETVVYDSMSTEQLEALITERGEWVYELYAVLIHSGVINGGHYYAYIKDLGTKRWWNFNDSTVTPMDEKAVQEAWGCEYTSSAAFNYPTPLYGRPLSVSGKSLSSSNAYMLMYRKATQLSAPSAEQNPSSSACEEATATPVASAAPRAVLSVCPVVTDEMVPAYIRELVQEETRLAEERLRLQAEERNRLSFKVYWQGVERTVRTTKSATYKQLLAQLWEEMEVKQHLGESLTHYLEKKQATQQSSSDSVELAEVCVDVASHGESSMQDDCSPAPLPAIDTEAPTVAAEDPLDGPCFDLFRLRNYNSFTHTKSDTYDYHSSGHLTLDALNFRDFRAYVLETRSGEDEWEQYFVDGLTLNIFEVDNNDEAASVTGTCTFKEPRSLRVQRSTTLGQLRLAISKWTAYPVERVQVMKITNCGFNDGQLDLLTNDAASLRDDLCIYDGGKLYIEEKAPVCEDQGEAKQQFKAFEAFLNLRNRIDIRVNRPPEDSFGHTLTVDLRWAVQELRAFVAEKLDLVDQELRLFKQSATGQELRDGPQTLAQAGVYNSMGLAVRLGKATPLGYFNVQFVEFVAKNSIGVVELPELEPEYEIVELASGNQPGSLLDPIDFWKDSTIDSIDDSPPPLVTVPFDNLSSAALGQGRGRELGQGLRLRARGAGNVFDDYEESGTEKNSVASNEGVADLSDVPDLVDEEEFPADFATTDTDTAAAIAASATAVEAVPMDDANNLANFADFSSAPAVTAVPAAAVAVDCCTDPVMPPSSTQQTFPMKPLSLSVESLYAVPADSKQFMKSDAALGEEDIDIAPSDFGERMVKNCTELTQFQPMEGFSHLFLQSSTTILEVKAQVANKLIELGRLPPGASPHRIRLREKLGNSPGQILDGDESFSDRQVYLFDNKMLAFQVLEHEEILPQAECGSVMVLVQRWNRSTWSLGDRFEVLLRGSMTIRNIARSLSFLTGIPLDSMRAMVLPREAEFALSDIVLRAPPQNYGRAWFDPTRERRMLSAMSHELRVTDGDVLLLQDTSEPLMELSAADRKSIEIVRVANQTSYWSAPSSVSIPTVANRNPFESYPTSTSTYTKGSMKHGYGSSNGVHIKTHRDRLQEQSDRSLNSTAAACATDVSDAQSTTGSASLSPVPPLEAVEADYVENNVDYREYEKHGGAALFSDIN